MKKIFPDEETYYLTIRPTGGPRYEIQLSKREVESFFDPLIQDVSIEVDRMEKELRTRLSREPDPRLILIGGSLFENIYIVREFDKLWQERLPKVDIICTDEFG